MVLTRAQLSTMMDPQAVIPGRPCAVSARAVMCVCGRHAAEHRPDRYNHAEQSAVRQQHARSDYIKMQALRAGYRNLKKTLHYHKRYLQAMGIYAPETGPHKRDVFPAPNGLDQPVINPHPQIPANTTGVTKGTPQIST